MLAEEGCENARFLASVYVGIVEDGIQLTVFNTHLVHQPHVLTHPFLFLGVVSQLEECLGIVDINTVVLHV